MASFGASALASIHSPAPDSADPTKTTRSPTTGNGQLTTDNGQPIPDEAGVGLRGLIRMNHVGTWKRPFHQGPRSQDGHSSSRIGPCSRWTRHQAGARQREAQNEFRSRARLSSPTRKSVLLMLNNDWSLVEMQGLIGPNKGGVRLAPASTFSTAAAISSLPSRRQTVAFRQGRHSLPLVPHHCHARHPPPSSRPR